MKTAVFAIIMTTCMLMTVPGTTAGQEAPAFDIKITEFLYNPTATELEGEFVELENLGSDPVEMGGWVLTDQDGPDDILFPNMTVAPGETAVIFSGAGNRSHDPETGIHWLYMNKTSSTWSNTGDDILLLDAAANTMDYVCYKNGSAVDPAPSDNSTAAPLEGIDEGLSYSLIEGNWKPTFPTPGFRPRIIGGLLISELCSSARDGGEFAALENRNPGELDISFCLLTDGEGTAAFPPGATIAGGGKLVVARNVTTYQNLTHEAADFGFETNMLAPKSPPSLANDGDELFLMTPDFQIIDCIVYGDSEYNGPGWEGQAAAKPKKAEVLTRGPGPDTDTSADWEDDSTRIAGQTSFASMTHAMTGEVKAFLSPDCSMDVILDELANATESIRINLYEFLNRRLGDELVSAVGRGVAVTLFVEGEPVGGLEDDSRQFLSWLDASGVDVRMHKSAEDNPAERYRFNHAKYTVIDDASTIVMTENWGNTGVPLPGSAGNRGWGAVIRSPDVAARYSELFEADSNTSWHDVTALEGNATSPPDICPGPAAGGIVPEFEPLTVEGEFDITPVIVPDQTMGPDDPVLALLDNATSEVLVEQFYIDTSWKSAPNPYLEAVIDAARRGCRVEVLLDSSDYNIMDSDTKDNDDTVRYINTVAKSEGLNMAAKLVRPDAHTFTKIHAKGIVVDGARTLISSINWNQNSVTRNREAGVIIDSAEVADYFSTAFESDWLDLVSDPGPVMEITGVLKAGRNITFDAGNSTASSNFTARWDLDGDRKVDAFNHTVVWAYDEPGQYTVALEIEDIWGNVNSTSLLIEIGEPEEPRIDDTGKDAEPVIYISSMKADDTPLAPDTEGPGSEITPEDRMTAFILLLPMLLVVAISVGRKMKKR